MLIAVGMFGFHSFSEKMSTRNEKCRDEKQFFRRRTSVPVPPLPVGAKGISSFDRSRKHNGKRYFFVQRKPEAKWKMIGFRCRKERKPEMENDRDEKRFFRRCTSVPVPTSARRGGVYPPVFADFVAHRVGVPTSASDCSIRRVIRENKIRRVNAAGTVVRIP